MKPFFLLFLLLAGAEAICQHKPPQLLASGIIGAGSVPDLATGANHAVHVVWGKGDSIMYAVSSDKGRSFSAPELVDTVPGLFSFAMRGPQITAIDGGACIIAGTQQGNLIAYHKKKSGPWRKTVRVNDMDTIAKEGFLDLDGDGKNKLFAAWLDIRRENQNNIVGAQSADGGKTWSANRMLYQSPDGHVCECCKPSVAVQGRSVSVMFRNWVAGSRDLWLLRSINGGATFEQAQKLGLGTWKLDGCPMDGGGLAFDASGVVQTIWRRKDTLFTSAAASKETALGQGRSGAMAMVGGKAVYAWVEKGEIVLRLPPGTRLVLGKGSLPAMEAVGTNSVLCLWEEDAKIHRALVSF